MTKKKKVLLSIILGILVGAMFMFCSNDLSGIQGPPEQTNFNIDTNVNLTQTSEVLYMRAESLSEILVVFDNQNAVSSITNISDFEVQSGSIEILDINHSLVSNLILYVSNQVAGEEIKILVKGFDITNYTMVQLENTNTTNIPSVIKLESDDYTFMSFGSDDNEPPEVIIIRPTTNMQKNLYIESPMILVSGFAFDNTAIEKIEYRIDNGNYTTLSYKDSFEFMINGDTLPTGEHFIKVRATDVRGYTRVAFQKINILRTKPNIYIKLFSPVLYNSGGNVSVEATTDDATTVSALMKITTPKNEYTINMSDLSGATNWGCTYNPDLWDSSTNTLEFYTINSVDFTNIVSKQVVLYEKSAIYVSRTGNDNNDGTIYNPLATIGLGVMTADAYGISKVKVSDGTFGFSARSGFVIEGGYSSDFSLYEPDVYISKVGGMSIDVNNVSVHNFVAGGVGIKNCSQIILSNITVSKRWGNCFSLGNVNNITLDDCEAYGYSDGSTRGMYISGNNNTIKNSYVHNNRFPATSYGGFDGKHRDYDAVGIYIKGSGNMIDNCRIENNNNSPWHGCFKTSRQDGSISRWEMSGNAYGGGIYAQGTASILNCIIANNSAMSYHSYWSSSEDDWGTVTYTCIETPTGRGGGVYRSGNITLSGNTFMNNSANGGGADIW